MTVDIITIFPEVFDFYFKQSLLGVSQAKKRVKIKAHNLRDFTDDKHKTVDGKPFGGGRGMVFRVEPILKAVEFLKKSPNQKWDNFLRSQKIVPKRKKRQKDKKRETKVVFFSPRGKKFNQKMATKWAKLDQLVLICGRYEGIDERVAKYVADEVISIGDYVLMGGELPAMIVIEAVARLLPGVVGKSEQLIGDRITKQKGFIEYPQYTRPEVIEINGKKRQAPKVLLSGNHKEIDAWRKKRSKVIE